MGFSENWRNQAKKGNFKKASCNKSFCSFSLPNVFFKVSTYYTSTKTHALSLIRVPDPSLLMLPQTNGFPADVLLQSDTADPPRVSDDDGH